jgi:hypothetical protein
MKLIHSLSAAMMIGTAAVPSRAQPPPAWYGEPPAGHAPPLRVTSDTPEFCAHLQRQFARVTVDKNSVPHESVTLAREGQRMCDMGLVRAGIARLRMAFFRMRADR